MTSLHGALIKPAYFENYFNYFKLFEAYICCLLVLALCLYFHLFTIQRVCHQNLCTLMLSQPTSLTLATIGRIIKHFLDYYSLLTPTTFQIFSFTTESLTGCSLQMTLGYAIERSISLYYLEDYDQKFTTNKFALCLIFCTTFGAAFEVLAIYTDFASGWKVFLLVYATYFCTIMFFLVLYGICRRMYRKVYKKRYSTIEDRYRTQENYKASRLLLYLAPYKCVTSIAICFLYEFGVDGDPYKQTFFTFIFFYSLQMQILVQMFVTIFAEPNLRRQFLRIIRLQTRVTPELTVRNAEGERMVFSKAESDDIYFKQFDIMWKTEKK